MAGAHPVLIQGLNAMKTVARQNGYGLVVTSVVRSRKTQERLYRNYLSGRSKYPAAPPGTSKHELGLAFDAVVEPRSDANQRRFGELWESWGGVWGGRFRDPIHFELRTT